MSVDGADTTEHIHLEPVARRGSIAAPTPWLHVA